MIGKFIAAITNSVGLSFSAKTIASTSNAATLAISAATYDSTSFNLIDYGTLN